MPRRHLGAVQNNAQMRASANQVLEAHSISLPPINIYQVLYSDEIPVDFWDFSSKVQGLYLNNATGLGIAINANHHPVKKRFTAAHELKHHRHDADETELLPCIDNDKDRKIEEFANRFAAELLVPVAMFQQVIVELQQTELLTVTTLRRVFHVSYPTVVYRLHTLGYVSSGQRDRLLKSTAQQEDWATTIQLQKSRASAKVKMLPLVAILGSSDGFSYCSKCSELIFDPSWYICHSCGQPLY